MSAIKTLNPQAEVARAHAALQININAAQGLQEVLRTNLGPKGTIKMYVRCPFTSVSVFVLA
jgi:T-complex protein 1 subunit zeta